MAIANEQARSHLQPPPITEAADHLPAPSFPAVFDDAVTGMALLAPDTRILRANAALCALLGTGEAQLKDQVLAGLAPAGGARPHGVDDAARLEPVLSGRSRGVRLQKQLAHASGAIMSVDISCSLAAPPSPGQPACILAQFQDITERLALEQALVQSEKRFRGMVRLTSDWYWEQDEEFRFTNFSGDAFNPAIRIAQTSAIGKRRWEIEEFSPMTGNWAEHQAVLAAHLPYRDYTYIHARPGQPPRYYTINGDPVFDGQGRFRGYRGTAREITDTLHASEQAQATAERLSTTLESLTDGFISLDRAWRFTYVNTRAEQMLQKTRAELLGNVMWALYPDADSSVLVPYYVKAMNENIVVQCEEFHPKYGMWVQVKIYPSPQGLAIFFRDITERVEAQQEILRLNADLEERVRLRTAQLEAANKDLQFFSYSIAHDLRGPLSSMAGFGQMLEATAGPELSDRSRHFISRIRNGARQMGELTDGLLALAQLSRTEVRHVEVDLATLAQAAVAAQREAGPGREVEVAMPESMPARGDPRLLGQVFGNLVGNAWKFTARQAAPRIEIGVLPAGDPRGDGGGGEDGGGAADGGARPVYFIRDNGAGFDMEYAARLFQPFQRMHTDVEFEGTGIGLSLVQKIVERHCGRIWAEARPDQGATFYFTLGA